MNLIWLTSIFVFAIIKNNHKMEGPAMTYTDLIFDLYGTLVDIHTEESDGCIWAD